MMIAGGIVAAVLSFWVVAPLLWGAAAATGPRSVCATCGARLESDARFCSGCGATVGF